MQLREQTTEDLARALLTAGGSAAPLTFRRLDREVEQEIGGAPPAGAGSG